MENRLLGIDDQFIRVTDRNLMKKSISADDKFDNDFCFAISKNRISELYRQVKTTSK